MCGFSGFTNPSNTLRDESILKKMLYPIKHRGPDEYNIFINNKIALGHYRLSIIDLKGGHQPCIDKEKNNYLVFNGEIYGYKKIAAQLKKKGIKFRDNSDTEVLFQSLNYLGVEKTLNLIDGMFSFAYFNGNNNSLWLVRDRLGEKPLYYARKNNSIYFSSEITGITASKQFDKKNIDKNSIISFLQLDYIPNDKTLIRNIYKVLPGEVIRFKNNELVKKQYFSINSNEKLNINLSEATEHMNLLLQESVKERLIADVPIGVFLSGGIDSSLIAYYAKKYKPDIQSFTIKMKNSSYDESEYAKLVAKKLKIKNNVAEFDNAEIIKSLETLDKKMDEPLADPSILPTFLLSKFAKNHVKVALSGDGADELFCGYAPFKSIKFLKLLHCFPKLIGNYIHITMANMPSRDNYMSYNFILKNVSKGLGWPQHQQIFRWMSPFSDHNLSTLLKKELSQKYFNESFWDELLPHNKNNNMDITDLVTENFIKHYLPNDILTKVDRASMYNGLEVRSPFLSKSIIDFSFKLPNKFKLKNTETKLILKNLSNNKIPNIIKKRKKHGFAIPLAEMMRGPLREKISDTLLSKNNEISNYFNIKNVENILNKHWNGIDNRKPIWAMYVLYKNYENISKTD